MSGKKLAIPIVFLTVFCVVLVMIFWAFDLVVNITPSMPVGIWRVFKDGRDSKNLKGNIILICPHQSKVLLWAMDQEIVGEGRCKSGSIPLLKEVVGVEGDKVEIFGDEVFLNGKFAAKRHFNMANQLMSEWKSQEISKDEVWVLGTERPESFDSRYLGALKLEGFLGIARPILVWKI